LIGPREIKLEITRDELKSEMGFGSRERVSSKVKIDGKELCAATHATIMRPQRPNS